MDRKSKLYPRKGDWVHIDHPEMFVRCGYPLCLKDVKDQIAKAHTQDIIDFIERISSRAEEKGTGKFASIRKQPNIYKKSVRDVIKVLAFEKIKAENFGGKERSIHTKFDGSMKGKVYQVKETKRVVTGSYVPGHTYHDYYSEYDEYEPPYLDGQKHHRILILGESYSGHVSMVKACWSMFDDFDDRPMIEDCHVTKIVDPEKELDEKGKRINTLGYMKVIT